MKLLFTSLAFLFTLIGSTLISPSDITNASYFEGKWDMLVKDTPQGNAVIPMRFNTVDGKTTGYFKEDPAGAETKMSSVSVEGDVIYCAFTIAGYDVTLDLKKVDQDRSTGSLLGMFTAEATRVK
jgi:hypothetical protein